MKMAESAAFSLSKSFCQNILVQIDSVNSNVITFYELGVQRLMSMLADVYLTVFCQYLFWHSLGFQNHYSGNLTFMWFYRLDHVSIKLFNKPILYVNMCIMRF